MSFPQNHDARYFSIDGYRAILVRALELGYRIVPFRAFEPPSAQPVLVLRHDLDRPLRSAGTFAELEAECGIRATYFVQTACEFYNLLSEESRALVKRLTALGHEVGLHYEAHRYLGEDGERLLLSDLRLLEDLSGQEIRSASQHIPIDDEVLAITRYIENDAYDPRFTQAPMTYISDSLMAWRQATPHDLLDRRASFQFLSHPDTWIGPYRDMGEALSNMMRDEMEAVRTRYETLTRYYETLIREREERDREFIERRSRPARDVGSREDA
jgi:hypothetical protein